MTTQVPDTSYLGPTYNYAKMIAGPTDIGMSDGMTFDALAKDVGGLITYIAVLVSGQSNAQLNGGKPLGNKFMLETLGTCKDELSGDIVPRSIYINNIPVGNIPFLSSAAGVDFKSFRGLIPGLISNVNVLNPIDIGTSLLLGSNPPCREVTWPIVDQSGNESLKTGYILLHDIMSMDPCDVSEDYKKPSWGQCDGLGCGSNECIEKFTNLFHDSNNFKNNDLLKEPFIEFYFIILGLLGLYIFLHLLHKSK